MLPRRVATFGSLVQAAQGQVEQPRGLDEELDHQGQALFGGKGVLAQASVVEVVADRPFDEVGAAQGAVDAFAGERVEEAGGVADQDIAGAVRASDASREGADADHGVLAFAVA